MQTICTCDGTGWIHAHYQARLLYQSCMTSCWLSPLPSLHVKTPEASCRSRKGWCWYGVCWWLYPVSVPNPHSICCRPSRTVLSCKKENWCPCCVVHPDQRDDLVDSVLQDPERSLKVLENKNGRGVNLENLKMKAFVWSSIFSGRTYPTQTSLWPLRLTSFISSTKGYSKTTWSSGVPALLERQRDRCAV